MHQKHIVHPISLLSLLCESVSGCILLQVSLSKKLNPHAFILLTLAPDLPARRQKEGYFPLEINKVSHYILIRTPGISESLFCCLDLAVRGRKRVQLCGFQLTKHTPWPIQSPSDIIQIHNMWLTGRTFTRHLEIQIHFPAELLLDLALVYFQTLRPGTGHLPLAVRFRLAARPGFGYDMKNVAKTNSEKIHEATRPPLTPSMDCVRA